MSQVSFTCFLHFFFPNFFYVMFFHYYITFVFMYVYGSLAIHYLQDIFFNISFPFSLYSSIFFASLHITSFCVRYFRQTSITTLLVFTFFLFSIYNKLFSLYFLLFPCNYCFLCTLVHFYIVFILFYLFALHTCNLCVFM